MTVAAWGLARTGARLEASTIVWNCTEGAVAIASGILAGSIVLTGFGIDSAIEVVSAGLVLRRLQAARAGAKPDEERERVTLRAVAGCLVALASYLVADGIDALFSHSKPETTITGLAITIDALVVMPSLGLLKVRVGRAMNCSLLLADASETWLCAAMSGATLAALALYACIGWTWVEPLVGFIIAAIALHEAREAWKGKLDAH